MGFTAQRAFLCVSCLEQPSRHPGESPRDARAKLLLGAFRLESETRDATEPLFLGFKKLSVIRLSWFSYLFPSMPWDCHHAGTKGPLDSEKVPLFSAELSWNTEVYGAFTYNLWLTPAQKCRQEDLVRTSAFPSLELFFICSE